jgi:hypothetical protein
MDKPKRDRSPRVSWHKIGRYAVDIGRQRKRYRSILPHDREVFAFLVLGEQPSPHTLRPTVAWGTVRRGVVTLTGGILPDSVRDYLERWP